MSGKPYQSKLLPYEGEIVALRAARPPTPYAAIAEILRQKYQLIIERSAIFKFVKVRSRGRKVYSYARPVRPKHTPNQKNRVTTPLDQRVPAPQNEPLGIPLSSSGPVGQTASSQPSSARRILKHFVPSLHYNLTRLTPEEKAAFIQRLQKGE